MRVGMGSHKGAKGAKGSGGMKKGKSGGDRVVTLIRIGEIVPTTDNPRRVDPNSAGIVDLAASLEKVGMLSPVIVRRHPTEPEKYDLRAGHRRLVAAERLGWATVPAMVLDLSDDEAVAVTVTENLQREDLTPLEEAEGMSRLTALGRTISEIAADLGRHPSYVARRLALTRLAPEVRKAIAEDDRLKSVPAGHLEEIARLPEHVQAEAIRNEWQLGRPLAEFRTHLRAEFSTQLKDAPWDVTAAVDDLVEFVAGCAACHKRTGADPLLFADLEQGEGDRCLDGECFGRKRAQWLRNRREELERKYGEMKAVGTTGFQPKGDVVPPWRWTPAKKSEKGAVPVFVANGEEAGSVKWAHIEPEPKRTEAPDADPMTVWIEKAADRADELMMKEIRTPLKKPADLLRAAAMIHAPASLSNVGPDPIAAIDQAAGDLKDWLVDDLKESLTEMIAKWNDPTVERIESVLGYAGRLADWRTWLEKNPPPATTPEEMAKAMANADGKGKPKKLAGAGR